MNKEDVLGIDVLRLANMYPGCVVDPFAGVVSKESLKGASISDSIRAILGMTYADARNHGDGSIASKLLLQRSRCLCGVGEEFFPVQQEAMRYRWCATSRTERLSRSTTMGDCSSMRTIPAKSVWSGDYDQ